MSIRCMVWAFDLLSKGRVPGGASTALVLLKLADRANDDGTCWPGIDTLGRDICLSRRTVERALSELVLGGLVRKITRRDSAGRDLSNVYHLNLDHLDEGGSQIDGGGSQIDGGPRKDDRGGPLYDVQTSKQKLSTRTPHQRVARACAREGGAQARPSSRLGRGMVESEEGIIFNQRDPRDLAILGEIRQHQTAEVARAVTAARGDDPLGRAFPSSVWRHLRHLRRAGGDDLPPWARVVGKYLSPPPSPSGGDGNDGAWEALQAPSCKGGEA